MAKRKNKSSGVMRFVDKRGEMIDGGIMTYGNNPREPLSSFVHAKFSMMGKNESPGEKAFLEYVWTLALENEKSKGYKDNPVTACQYIVETLAQYAMLAARLDDDEDVVGPLALSCIKQMNIQFYG